jgi:hypothetical protein
MSNNAIDLLSYQNNVDALRMYNGSTQVNEAESSCRGCDTNLSTNNPASQYQRQKIIQNTVRVPSSLYTMNLGALNAYKKPLNTYQFVEQAGTQYITPPFVNWNQMSDRPIPSVQYNVTGSGSAYGSNSTKHTIVRNRPGAMSPGGIGVDIKHNSYDRYLRRLKGKKPLRRGIIPPNYGAPIVFNRAYPIYGGKIVKTSIIDKCDCPEQNAKVDEYKLMYENKMNAIQDSIFNVIYQFNVGDFVFAKKTSSDITTYKAQIKTIVNGYATIEFESGLIITTSVNNLSIYYNCVCNGTQSIIADYLDNEFNVNYNAESFFCQEAATL